MWPVESQPLWTAVVSSVPKVRGARLVCLSSAGDPAHWSFKVRERARTSRRWRLHEVPGPVSWVDREDLDEQRALLTDSQFERLHLNVWTASEDRLVSVEGLAEAVVLDGPQDYRRGVVYKIGVDLGLRNDRTAIVVAHAESVVGRRRVVLDRLVVFEGSKSDEVTLGEVEDALLDVWRMYGRPRVRMDPWQAVGLAQRLRQKGVSVEEWSYSPLRYGAAASALYGLLRDGLLALYPHEALLDELANVRLRETLPGQVRVDHDPGRHDDMVQALGFAVTALLEKPSRGGRLHLPPDSLRVPRTVPPPVVVKSEDGPPVLVVDAKTGQPRKVPPPRDRIGQLIPPELRHRRREGYTPPGEWRR
jgi:phage terminase large subunit-like protein